MGKDTLEIIVTVGLFLLNATVITVFASVCVVYYLAIDVNRLLRCRKFKVMRLVTDEAVLAQELARPDTGHEGLSGAAANDPDGTVPALCWRHPGTGAAQVYPPKQVYVRDGVAEAGWVWTDADGNESWSKETPQLVAALAEGEKKPTPGNFVCNIDIKTLIMSPLAEVPPDVMSSRDDRRGDGAAVGALESDVDGDDVEMQERENPEYAGERTKDPTDEGKRDDPNERAFQLDNPLGEAARRAGHPRAATKGRVAPSHSNSGCTVEMTALSAGWREHADESGNACSKASTRVAKHPRGWSAHTVEDGSVYYNNDHTNETTWEKPTLPAPPAGWLVRPHADHGQYYKNIGTGEKTWVHPHDTDEVEVLEQAPADAAAAQQPAAAAEETYSSPSSSSSTSSSFETNSAALKEMRAGQSFDTAASEDNPMEQPLSLGVAGHPRAATKGAVAPIRFKSGSTVEMTAFPGAVVELGVAAEAAVQHLTGETPGEHCPRGWSTAVSQRTGSTYYNNDHTEESTYDKPTLPAPPAGWRVQLEDDTVRYTNAETEEMQWHHPLDTAPTHPRGWSERTEANGHTFYQNEHTGVSTYDKPTLPAPPEGWSVHAHEDEDGVHYFQHDAGGCETQWHHPFDEDPNDAATMTGSTAEAAAAASDEWYYNDYVNVDELHGPFALAQLKAWVDEGEMPASRLVRNGREGKEVELGSCG